MVKNTTGATRIEFFIKNLPNVYYPVPCHPFINESVTIFRGIKLKEVNISSFDLNAADTTHKSG